MAANRTKFHIVMVGVDAEDAPCAAVRILDAAIKEFDEAGYAGASIRNVAKRAGTSKSLVNYHFPTKASLAASILSLAYPSGVFMGVERSSTDPLQAIVDAVEHVAGSIAHQQLARVAINLHYRRELREVRVSDMYAGWTTRFVDYLEEARQQGALEGNIDICQEARLLVGGVAGLVTMASSATNYVTLVDDALAVTRDRISVVSRRSSRALQRA